jgi:predicted metal-dependent phosphoesterase TrpH
VRTAGGEVLGLFLERDVPRGLSARETVGLIKEQGGLVGVPHPFDHLRSELGEAGMLPLIGEIDFIEALNSRVVFAVHNKQALEFARRHGKPVSAASDAHSPARSPVLYRDAFIGPADFRIAEAGRSWAGRARSSIC